MSDADASQSAVDGSPYMPHATPPPPQHGVLMGPLGLRAGWGILLYIVLAVILSIAASLGVLAATGQLRTSMEKARASRTSDHSAKKAPAAAQESRAKTTILGESGTLTGVALAAVLMGLIERRRVGVYGIGRVHLQDFLPGALCGLAALALLVGLLRGFHLLVFDAELLHGAPAVISGLKWLLAFLLVGLFEEYLFRGYIQFTLVRGLLRTGTRISPAHARTAAFVLASIVTSAIFFFAHGSNQGETFAGLCAVFLAGVVFTFALWRTGSLWWAIGFHTTWDWAQSFLFGVPDSGGLSAGRLFATHPTGNVLLSGGTVGPEGSLLVIPVLLLVLLVLLLRKPAAQPPLEPETAHPHEQPVSPMPVA